VNVGIHWQKVWAIENDEINLSNLFVLKAKTMN
jgi:hypothetical protein